MSRNWMWYRHLFERGALLSGGAIAYPLPTNGTTVDDSSFTTPVAATTVSGSVKLSGKKAAGSAGKFIYSIASAPTAGYKYTAVVDPDFSALALHGKLAFVGFGLKNGNNFHLVGLKGDGATGLLRAQISGSSFSTTSGATVSTGTAPANGTQAGPNLIQFEVSSDGLTYIFRTGTGTDPATATWTAEYSAAAPSPLASATGATSFGLAAYFDGSDTGSFSIDVSLWQAAAATVAEVSPSFTNPMSTGNRLNMMTISSVQTLNANAGYTLLDGTTATGSAYFSVATGNRLSFDFGEPVILTGAKWYQTATTAQGTWQWEGSDTAAGTRTALGSTFALGGSTAQTITEPASNTTRYRFYHLTQISGNASNGPNIREIEFQVSEPSYTPISTSYTNPGGTGDRRGIITVTASGGSNIANIANLVDGSLTTTGGWYPPSGAACNLTFDFGSAKVVTEARWVQSAVGRQGASQWSGSNDGTTFTPIGGQFLPGSVADEYHKTLRHNSTAYRYYRWSTVAGSSALSNVGEIEFKISA